MMTANLNLHPQVVIERLHKAQNQHDLDAFVACFALDYQSEQPLHPDRAFRGREQVRKNWSSIFSEIPDFQSELVRTAVKDNTVWAEWHWHGKLAAGGQFDWRGVTIFEIQDDSIAWGRLYMEPLREAGGGIDAAVQRMTHGLPRER
jgi:hypothetical protein